jgi:hypothetical protein
LRTDGGGEFHSTVMKLAKDKLGVEDQYIPPHCHQSNGLVERLNYTLAGMIRTVLKQANLPPQLWGEAALYAAHVYNLTPHSTLMERKTASVIPHCLYMDESVERMQRLYAQLVPFGIRCNIILTGDKPQKVKKLDLRSVPGIVLGMGPSTKQYRVLLADANKKAEVHIVRHIIVNARHFQEYFSRSDVVPEVQRCVAAYSCTPRLSLERVPPLAILAETIEVPMVIPCMTATPARALSRGSECADIQEIEEEVREQLLNSQQEQ